MNRNSHYINLGNTTADVQTNSDAEMEAKTKEYAEKAKTLDSLLKNVVNIRQWFNSNRDNTTKFPGGWVEFWKYFPGQPLFGKPITNTDVTVGYMKQYEKDLFADGVARAAGINDYAMMESLFKSYAPKFLNDSSVNKSWATFWKALVNEYNKDVALVNNFNTGGGSNNSGSGNSSSGPNTAQIGGIAVGAFLLLVAANSFFKPTPKQVNN